LHDQLLDVAGAAATLGLKSPRTLYKWAYAGRIPSIRIGRLLRFRRSDLERLITDGERPAVAPPNGFPSAARALGR
jgi:excisionase family DNA binding protein